MFESLSCLILPASVRGLILDERHFSSKKYGINSFVEISTLAKWRVGEPHGLQEHPLRPFHLKTFSCFGNLR